MTRRPRNDSSVTDRGRAVGRAFSARGDRPTQEDRYLIWEGRHRHAGPLFLYAVFDGHAGALCADLCRAHLVPLVLCHSAWNGPHHVVPVEQILRDAIARLELICLSASRQAGSYDGTTLCVLLLVNGCLHVAHVGDSRAVLLADRHCIPLTHDHKPAAEAEAPRLRRAGAVVNRGRLVSQHKHLDVSRSIGDRDYKDAGKVLAALPDVSTIRMEPHQQALLLATDGFWDISFLDRQLPAIAVDALAATSDVAGVAERLVRDALRFRSRDNVTLILVRLNVQNFLPDEPVASEYTSYHHRPRLPPELICHHWEASPLPPSRARLALTAFGRLLRRPSWPRRPS